MKTTDRRRIRLDGEENAADDPPAAAETPPGAPHQPSGGEAPDADAARTIETQAARVDELTRAYARLLDDNQAFRQRTERERERLLAAEKERLVGILLGAHDDLELALRASRASPGADTPALRDLREGVRLTLAGLEKRIVEMGAERIPVVGTAYDARTAEAVDLVVVGDPAQDGVVVEEIRPGWRVGERVVRPARVRVGRLPQA